MWKWVAGKWHGRGLALRVEMHAVESGGVWFLCAGLGGVGHTWVVGRVVVCSLHR